MAKLLVAGGLEQGSPAGSLRERFCRALGRHIVLRGHTLLGGCRTILDRVVADAAVTAAVQKGIDPRKAVRSWVTGTTSPTHSCGELVRSALNDWSQVPRGYTFPEPISEADAVIIVGGWEGTHFAASWTRIAGKPLLPVAAFRGAADEIFQEEIKIIERRPHSTAGAEEFRLLNRILPDESDATIDGYALEVLRLAERTILPSDVFVIMSFADKPHLRDAYDTIRRVCENMEFSAVKVDEHVDATSRIVPAIFTGIKRSAFVIADLTDARPNVYYELGYAHALGKAVIQTAQEGTPLHFDVYDVPTHFWNSQGTLETKLRKAIEQLKNAPGRIA